MKSKSDWVLINRPSLTVKREAPGVISKDSCWVIIYPGYLHIKDSFLGVLWEAFTEYKHDKHLVGY